MKTIDLRAKARQHRDAMNRSAKAEIASHNRTAIIENSARSMRSLNISNNRLNSLETIDLSCNSISRLPLSTSELVKIQSFNLSSNNLQEFPCEICKYFIELVDLNLSSNRIMFLPSEFAHLKSLQKIDLHHNNFRAIPLEFVQVAQRLSFIDLRQNPFDLLTFKWNYQWSRKAQFENQSGYSTTEVLEWLKHEVIFYNAAKEERELTGSLFLDGYLGVDQFIHGEEKLKVVGVLERIQNYQLVMTSTKLGSAIFYLR